MDSEYEYFGKDVCAKVTGIGKVNAAMAATELIIREEPDYVISTGCAGAMAPELSVGDLVISTASAYHDVWCGEPNKPGQVQGCPAQFMSDPELFNAAITVAKRLEIPYKTGKLCTGDQFFISIEEDERIRSVHPDVLAADMESAAIAQVCDTYRIPFISIRFISDIHTSEQIQKETYDNFWKDTKQNNYRFISELIGELQSINTQLNII